MAHSTQPIRPIHFILGGSAFALLLLLTLGTVIALWWHAETSVALTPSDWSIIQFTIVQALASASISILIAIVIVIKHMVIAIETAYFKTTYFYVYNEYI